MSSRGRDSIPGQVQLVHWNPRRHAYRGPLVGVRTAGRWPITRRVNNFGDMLGPKLVGWMRTRLGLTGGPTRSVRLLTVGSIMHMAGDGDVVWGAGVNGLVRPEDHRFAELDVRAVRGPLTHAFLRERGIAEATLPYGDPGLLVGLLRPDLRALPRDIPLTVVPNLMEAGRFSGPEVLNPRAPLEYCLRRIARSQLVVGSSLHGVIIAEALGIPARGVRTGWQPSFKYIDYYKGTGREVEMAGTVAEAIAMGGAEPPDLALAPLVEAFPRELWMSAGEANLPSTLADDGAHGEVQRETHSQ